MVDFFNIGVVLKEPHPFNLTEQANQYCMDISFRPSSEVKNLQKRMMLNY